MIYIIVLFFTLSFSATLHVPGEYRTINAAFENVSENDTVLVAVGTHYMYAKVAWPAVDNIIFNNLETPENNLGITE